MLNIKIDKQYQIPIEWSDLSFEKSLDVSLMVEKMPKPFKQRFFSEEKQDEITNDDILKYLEFKIDYLNLLTGIDRKILMNIKPKNGVDINTLFEITSKFLAFPNPDEIEIKEYIELEGVKMYQMQSAVDSFGVKTNFQNADFGTYMTGMTIQTIIDNIKKGDFKQKELTWIAACIFRPKTTKRRWFKSVEEFEQFDMRKIEERALKMLEMPADQIYSAYFFLQQQQSKYLNDMQSSLKKLESRLKKGRSLRLRLTMVWLKWSILGPFMRMRLLSAEYLTKLKQRH